MFVTVIIIVSGLTCDDCGQDDSRGAYYTVIIQTREQPFIKRPICA